MQSMPTKNPVELSTIVAGCWRMATWPMNTQQRLAWIEACLDLGISSFDHADLYGDYAVQALFGQALKLKPSLRSRMQIISKAGICSVSERFPQRRVKHYDSSAAHLIASCEQSLRDLSTDYLDVLLIHRPDPLSDWAEIAEAFEQLKTTGKVRSLGVSNFDVAQFAALHHRTALITNQIEMSVLQTQALHDGSLLQAQETNCRPMIWSPLAGGRLFKADDAQAQRVMTVLNELAEQLSTSVSTVAYAWLLRHPSRPHIITGSQRTAALTEAVDAQNLQLTREQWTAIWQASLGHRVA
jgi:predicted oxidoreductase